MKTHNKFQHGDLVHFPEYSYLTSPTDIGIIIKIEQYDYDTLYHIQWAIDGASTIEESDWVHEHIKLLSRP
jgi:hypothetical protein